MKAMRYFKIHTNLQFSKIFLQLLKSCFSSPDFIISYQQIDCRMRITKAKQETRPGCCELFCCFAKAPFDCCRRIGAVILLRALFLAVVATLLPLAVLFFDDLKDHFLSSLRWIEELGMFYGALVMIGANTLAAVLMLPCLPFTLASGTVILTVTHCYQLVVLQVFCLATFLAQ